MASIFSTGLLSCSLAIASLSSALAAAGSCATGFGPVDEGTMVVQPCIGAPTPVCPGRGPILQCKDGKWFCVHKWSQKPLEPCTADQGGAWIWTKDQGLHRP
jgi:hypothetical protein